MSDSRVNFSPSTKQLIGQRAGYRCSFVSCGRLTVGPGEASDSKRSVGRACHIYSAVEGGPRGQGGLDEQQIESPENGIWMCATHADLIDKGSGADYPAAKLQAYKRLAEAKAARELDGLTYTVHWLERLTIRSNPLFLDGSLVLFGKITLIVGPNMSGKSALCDWIAGFGDQRRLWRWLPRGRSFHELDLQLAYHKPEAVTVRMQIPRSGQLGFSVDGQPGPIQPMGLNFVYLHEEWPRQTGKDFDDIELICRRLDVAPLLLPNLFPLVDSDGLGFARNLRLDEVADDENASSQKTRRLLRADVRGTVPDLPFRVLSHGEQQYVLVELAVALARYTARFAPTMLVLDGGMARFGDERLTIIMTSLAHQNIHFQTLIALPRGEGESVPVGREWTVVRLFPAETNRTGIRQD